MVDHNFHICYLYFATCLYFVFGVPVVGFAWDPILHSCPAPVVGCTVLASGVDVAPVVGCAEVTAVTTAEGALSTAQT